MISEIFFFTFLHTTLLFAVFLVGLHNFYCQNTKTSHVKRSSNANRHEHERQDSRHGLQNTDGELTLTVCRSIIELNSVLEDIARELELSRIAKPEETSAQPHTGAHPNHSPRQFEWVPPSHSGTCSPYSVPESLRAPRARPKNYAGGARAANDREARDGVAEAGSSSAGIWDRRTAKYEANFPEELVSRPQNEYGQPKMKREEQEIKYAKEPYEHEYSQEYAQGTKGYFDPADRVSKNE